MVQNQGQWFFGENNMFLIYSVLLIDCLSTNFKGSYSAEQWATIPTRTGDAIYVDKQWHWIQSRSNTQWLDTVEYGQNAETTCSTDSRFLEGLGRELAGNTYKIWIICAGYSKLSSTTCTHTSILPLYHASRQRQCKSASEKYHSCVTEHMLVLWLQTNWLELVEDHPELPAILQEYINERVPVKDIPSKLEKINIRIR